MSQDTPEMNRVRIKMDKAYAKGDKLAGDKWFDEYYRLADLRDGPIASAILKANAKLSAAALRNMGMK